MVGKKVAKRFGKVAIRSRSRPRSVGNRARVKGKISTNGIHRGAENPMASLDNKVSEIAASDEERNKVGFPTLKVPRSWITKLNKLELAQKLGKVFASATDGLSLSAKADQTSRCRRKYLPTVKHLRHYVAALRAG